MSKKIFISQPMHGKELDEIIKRRDETIESLKKTYKDIEVVESLTPEFNEEGLSENQIRIKRLARSIDKLAEADLVVFLDDYESASGCMVEYIICTLYGLNTVVHK